MKKKILLTSISTMLILTMFITSPVYAKKISTKITSEEFLTEFDPNKSTGIDDLTDPVTNTMQTVVNIALGIIQVIGVLLTAVSLVIFGYNRLLSANGQLAGEVMSSHGPHGFGDGPSTKMALLNHGRSMMIGSIILFSSTTIVRIIFNLFIKA